MLKEVNGRGKQLTRYGRTGISKRPRVWCEGVRGHLSCGDYRASRGTLHGKRASSSPLFLPSTSFPSSSFSPPSSSSTVVGTESPCVCEASTLPLFCYHFEARSHSITQTVLGTHAVLQVGLPISSASQGDGITGPCHQAPFHSAHWVAQK